MHQDPHQLIEGTMISCFANNVKQAYIYIRGEMPHGARILEKAIAEARAANFVGPNILGTNYSCEIYVHRGAGAYICGEETGLIESLEGKRANPRIKPPYFPAVLGLYQCPTIVNNVETLCHVKHIVDMGGEAYAKIGTPNNTGTRIFCVSGHVQKPGLLRVRGRQDHDGPAAQRGLRRPAARPHLQGRHPRRLSAKICASANASRASARSARTWSSMTGASRMSRWISIRSP
jgi:hypothetical protein